MGTVVTKVTDSGSGNRYVELVTFVTNVPNHSI